MRTTDSGSNDCVGTARAVRLPWGDALGDRRHPEVPEDLRHHVRLIDDGENLHPAAALGAGKNVDLKNPLQERRPIDARGFVPRQLLRRLSLGDVWLRLVRLRASSSCRTSFMAWKRHDQWIVPCCHCHRIRYGSGSMKSYQGDAGSACKFTAFMRQNSCLSSTGRPPSMRHTL